MMTRIEKQRILVKKVVCELLDDSFEIEPVVDPIEMSDGGNPPWVVIVQILKYFNCGNRYLDLRVPVRNGKAGNCEIMTEKTDVLTDGTFTWNGMQEVIERIRNV